MTRMHGGHGSPRFSAALPDEELKLTAETHGGKLSQQPRVPKARSPGALLASMSIHGAIVALVVVAANSGSESDNGDSQPAPGIVGSAERGTGGGVSAAIAAPPAGPSLNPLEAARYVGSYRVNEAPDRAELRIAVVNDGESEPHWALTLYDGSGPVHKLVVVAPDTFALQLAPRQLVIFRRQNDSVTAVSVRRSRDTSWAERVASLP